MKRMKCQAELVGTEQQIQHYLSEHFEELVDF